MIITIRFINTSVISHNYNFFFVVVDNGILGKWEENVDLLFSPLLYLFPRVGK